MPVEVLVNPRHHSKEEQITIVETVIMLLEAHLVNLEIWEKSRDRRYSNKKYLNTELAIKVETILLDDIRSGRAAAKYLRCSLKHAAEDQRIAA